MTAWLTNINFYGLAVIPAAALLWLCDMSLFSLSKLLITSLLLQLLLSVVLDAMVGTRYSPVPIGARESGAWQGALEVVAYAVVDPLVTICFFSWVLHTPRAFKSFGITDATAKAVALATHTEGEEEKKRQQEMELSPFFQRIPQRLVLAMSRAVGGPTISPLIAIAVPWYLAHFILFHWSMWYTNMSSEGDVAGVWSAMYELFFYLAASCAMARRLGVKEGRGPLPLVGLGLLITCCTSVSLAICSGLLVPGVSAITPVNTQLVVSILWSVC